MRRADAGRLACAAGALALVVSLSAQTPPGDADAELSALYAKAQTAVGAGDWKAALEDWNVLLAAARARNAAMWEGRGLLGLARAANQTARYRDARSRAQQALEIFERLHATDAVGDASRTLGISDEFLGEAQAAGEHYRRAIEAYRVSGNVRARLDVELHLRNMSSGGDVDLESYDALLADARTIGDRKFEGRLLHDMGDQLFARSQYQPAIEKLEAAAALFEAAGDASNLGTTYNSLGRLYRAHGQPRAALEFQQKALAIHESLGVPRLFIQSLNATAVALQLLGRNEEARGHYERALAEAERSGVKAYVDFVHANLGSFLVYTSTDVLRGVQLLEEATKAAGSQALRWTQLSRGYLELGRRQDALDAARRGVAACVRTEDCMNARAAVGEVHLALGDEDAALADFREVLAAVEKLHGTLARADVLRQNFPQMWEQAYSLAIDLHFRRGEYREALEASELSRSRAFLDLLATRTLQGRAEPAGGRAEALRSDADAPPPTVETLTAVACRLRSTLLAYWVGPDTVYIWTLSPDGRVHGATTSIARSKLDDLIRAGITFGPAAAATNGSVVGTRGDSQIAVSPRNRRAWRALYDALVAPVERHLPTAPAARLTIVPHGPLLGLPFAALRDARGRYLVERYTLHSVPAAAVLRFTESKIRASVRTGAVLLVADPARPPRIAGEAPLPRLAGASDEIRRIARLLPPSRTMRLAGTAATESRVRDALPGKAVVHFATHAIVRDANPLASFLALGAAGEGPDAGQLTADKIYGLDLDAGLVVLSACRSGGGVVTGDGISGLARAFFYAGAPSVVVSVWDVADRPTDELIPAFYRAWLRGQDKAAALRTAQLSLIRRLRAGEVKVTLPVGTVVLPEDPAFWAAFVLLGEPD